MDPRYGQAMEHLAAKRFAQAKPLLLQVVRRNPDDGRAVMHLAQCCTQLGELDQAAYFGEKMVRLIPDVPAVATYYAKILQAQSKFEEAARAAGRGLALLEARGFDQAAFTDLVFLSAQLNDYVMGLRADDVALKVRPTDVNIILQRAHHLGHLGRLAESRAAFEHAATIDPTGLPVLHGLAWHSVYDPDLDAAEVFRRHRAVGEAIERAARARHGAEVGTEAAIDPAAGVSRPLRVGLLSSDLRRHSCAFFMRPILAHAARAGVHLRVYSTNNTDDDFTADLRSLVPPADWLDLGPRSLPERVRAIRADRPDVLVCCSGLYVDESMATLALRPAAVQADYMGYPHTTGMRAVDYRLVDAHTDPPESLATETLLRIAPCFLCYAPATDAPPVRPREGGGPVTFVSFNNAMKHNDRVLAVWGRVLRAVPGARLVIKTRGLEHEAGRADLRARLLAAGAPVERVDLTGWTKDRGGHMARYHEADVALDPFPYHGTTTTCEALLMGVPVVTLAGAGHASRVGVSLLHAVGVPELVAADEDAYVRIAAELAGDAERRATLRRTLRERVLASPLCDGAGFAARLGDTLRAAHRRLCPPA